MYELTEKKGSLKTQLMDYEIKHTDYQIYCLLQWLRMAVFNWIVNQLVCASCLIKAFGSDS